MSNLITTGLKFLYFDWLQFHEKWPSHYPIAQTERTLSNFKGIGFNHLCIMNIDKILKDSRNFKKHFWKKLGSKPFKNRLIDQITCVFYNLSFFLLLDEIWYIWHIWKFDRNLNVCFMITWFHIFMTMLICVVCNFEIMYYMKLLTCVMWM